MDAHGRQRRWRGGLRAARLLCATLAVLVAAPAAATELATRVFHLQHLEADRAKKLHARVIGEAPGSRVVAGPGVRILTVRDTPTRLTRFEGLLERLDVRSRGDVRIYVRAVVHRAPSELLPALGAVCVDGSGVTCRLVPDDRSGLLVVVSTLETYRKIHTMVERLDVRPRPAAPSPADGGGG